MKAVAANLKSVKLKEQFVYCKDFPGNLAMCLLLEITIIFRDSDIQIFLNGDVFTMEVELTWMVL